MVIKDTQFECFVKYLQIKKIIQIANEAGIDISNELEPLKSYDGNNIFILDLKREAFKNEA